jgi:superfamily II DNA or RNA helicase
MKVTKDEIQSQARQAVRENGGSGMLLIATGVGKSKIGVDEICESIDEMTEYDFAEYEQPLIVVPTRKLRDNNWKDEFTRWSDEDHYNSITTVCYKSVNKFEGKKFKIVVLDEAHRITDLSFEFFKNNIVEKVIILTATKPRDRYKRELLESLAPIVFEYPLDQAVRDGLVAPFDIYVIKVPLNTTDRNIKCGSKTKSWYSTEKTQYEYISSSTDKAREEVANWKQENYDLFSYVKLYRDEEKDKKDYFLQQWPVSKREDILKGEKKLAALESHSLIKTMERVRFIGNLPSKEKIADDLMTRLIREESRFLTFCASILQTERLCHGYTFHSETNSDAFNAFVNQDIDFLGVVDSVNEGLNLPMIDDAIIIKLNSNDLNFIQRLGRIVRLRDNHRARMFIVTSDTEEELNWVASSLKSFDKDNISYYNVLNYHKIFEREE